MFLSEDVHNFMEPIVEEEFSNRGIAQQYDNDYVQDLFCLTLNALPPRYLRHALDVRMNMTAGDRERLSQDIGQAIEHGHAILRQGRRTAARL